MASFTYSIKMALLLFPLVALLFTLPYILYQYHKYGSVNSYRSIIIYSFLLYLMSAYFLVILPLPSIDVVSKMTRPSYNLNPCNLIIEIFSKTGFHVSDFATYFPTMKNPVVYEAFFNILLTVPFGIYLHYYFKCDFKHTLFYSFSLTLFFELTQLTGLYFIYPRAYRVFDVDDLILNTLGGLFGYFLAFLFLKILPTRDEIDEKSIQKGKNVSIMRRTLSFLIDFTMFNLLLFSTLYLLKINHLFSKKIFFLLFFVFFVLYYIFLPKIMKDRTVGMKFLKLKFNKNLGCIKWYHYFLYYFTMAFEYILLPIIFIFISIYINYYYKIDETLFEYSIIIILALTLMIYIITFLKRLFHLKTLYEKVSKIAIVSTIGK